MTRNIKENWTEEGKRVFNEIAQPSPSCLKCKHFLVCKIAANVFPMIEGMFPDVKPFKADEIAKICQFYELIEFPEQHEASRDERNRMRFNSQEDLK
jgi:hypothetical protein